MVWDIRRRLLLLGQWQTGKEDSLITYSLQQPVLILNIICSCVVETSGPEALKVADNDGETPLHTAARGSHLDVVRWLLEVRAGALQVFELLICVWLAEAN
jgi:hypothetical protein